MGAAAMLESFLPLLVPAVLSEWETAGKPALAALIAKLPQQDQAVATIFLNALDQAVQAEAAQVKV